MFFVEKFSTTIEYILVKKHVYHKSQNLLLKRFVGLRGKNEV